MRTKRKQRTRSLHATAQSPEEPNEFPGLPEAYLDHEQRLIQNARDTCPCCVFRKEEAEDYRLFKQYHDEVTARVALQVTS